MFHKVFVSQEMAYFPSASPSLYRLV